MKSLFICKEIPYPPSGGVPLRNWQNMNALMKYGPVALFTASNWTPKRKSLPGIDLWEHCNVERQRSSWERLQRRFWWMDVRRHPDADWAYARQAERRLEKFLQKFRPDLVIFEEVWLYRYLKIVQRHCSATVLDNHNVELMLAQQNLQKPQSLRAHVKSLLMIQHLKKIEKYFINNSSQVWVCSHEDAHLTSKLYGSSTPVKTIPNSINVENYAESEAQDKSFPMAHLPKDLGKNRQVLIFLGLMSYRPNILAVQWLIREIFPQIQHMYPEAKLLLVGRNPTQAMREAAIQNSGIIVTGSVPDVRPYLKAASIMLVPLKEGSGTRFKILEAFAAKCPVISTSKGAEGIEIEDNTHLFIRDRTADIVSAVGQLWAESESTKALSCAAYELVQQKYSWQAVNQSIASAIEELKLT